MSLTFSRSAINDRVKFILDTCVDDAGTVIEQFNAEFGAGAINIPTNFDTEVDGEGVVFPNAGTEAPHMKDTPPKPDAPTLPPEVEDQLKSCNMRVLEKIKGKGTWQCTGSEDKKSNAHRLDRHWFSGSKCKVSNFLGSFTCHTMCRAHVYKNRVRRNM